MASYINTNYASLQAQNNLTASQSKLQTSIARLSSGLRINSAADDAAGLAIADRMTSQINGLNQASRNANDGISLAQTADGALASVSSDLQRIRQLAVQSANSTNSSSDRASLNQESQQLLSEISRVAGTTQFNGLNLLDGSFQGSQFQVGANANQTINVTLSGATTTSLGSYGGAGQAVTTAGPAAGVAVATGAFTSVNTLSINGTKIGATSDSNPSTNMLMGFDAGSAYAKAQAINAQTSLTGVTAQATTVVNGGSPAVGTTAAVAATPPSTTNAINAGDLIINGIAVGSVSAGANAVSQGQNVAAAINAVSAQTGVVAQADSGTGAVKLTASDGRDINIAAGANAATSLNTDTGLSSSAIQAATFDSNNHVNGGGTTTGGTLTLTSAHNFSLAEGGTGTGGIAAAGLTAPANANTAGFSQSLTSLSSVDLSTVTGANTALGVVDAAISQIDSQRAVLGATSNRFQATVTNLSQTSANLSSARSRIQDTDFAAETANLSQAQILQQAGTAMLTQANSLPNSVLTLLKG